MNWTAADVASRLEAKRMQGYWLARCPAHDDSKPSFSIREMDGKPVFRCFGGCSRESIREALASRGIDLRTAPDAGWETVYGIKDADGRQVAEHVRVDRADGKQVFWRPKLSDIGMRVVDVPLYGAELLKSKPKEPVVLTEGEKAAEAVRRMGLLGLGTVTGAATAPCEAVLSVLLGRKVYLWPDNDDDGRGHMARIAKTLTKLGIRHDLVSWPEAPPKGDAADFVGIGRGLEQFWTLVPQRKVKVRALWEGVSAALRDLDLYSAADFSGRVTTGLPHLDRHLRGGMRGGQLLLLGAPTGAGKTSLVQQMAVAAARQTGKTVLLVSPEMSLESLAERAVIAASGHGLWERNPWKAVSHHVRERCETEHARAASAIIDERLSVLVLERTDVSMSDIVDACDEIEDLALVVIDYAQEVAGDAPNVPRYLQVGEVGSRSVELAIKRQVPVIVASQVNTVKEGRTKTYTFRETSVLEHKAHTVLILDVEWVVRDERFGIRSVDSATLVCTKNRDGFTFRLKVHYEPELYRITDQGEDSYQREQYPLLPPAMPA